MKQPLEHFDAQASQWDEDTRRVFLARAIARKMIETLRLGEADVVLDYGAGTGLGTVELARAAGQVIAAEPSAKMYETLCDKLSNSAIANVTPVRWSTIEAYPCSVIPNIVTGAMVLHHVEDITQAARTFAGLLASGGRIAFADLDSEGGAFHGPSVPTFHDGFDREELGRVFGREGFGDIVFHEAAQVEKPTADGGLGVFSVFLMTGRKR